MGRAQPRYWYDRLLASDPALERLRSGLRALFTAAIGAALFLPLTHALGLEYKLSLPGVVVPMMAVVALQDPGRRRQQVTMAWVPVVASITLVIGAFVADNPWLGGPLFIAAIFGGFQAKRFGARGAGLGTLAYQSFFYALLFKTPPDKAPWTPLFVFTGCAVAWAVHFWIVPEHPGRALKHELRAYRARIRALLADLARRIDKRGDNGQQRAAAHVRALAGQSLALDGRLSGFVDDEDAGKRLREAVLRSELAADSLAAAVHEAGDGGADRSALASCLRALRADDAQDAGAASPSLPEPLRWRFDHAAQALARNAPWRQPLPAMRDERKPAPPDTPKPDGPQPVPPLDRQNGRRWFDDTTRRALQAGVAALAALLVGRAISPTHWFWAVFAALVVFTRSVTVGQTVAGAWKQVLAAAAGVGVGMLVAELAHGQRNLELGLLFAFIAIGFYAYKGLQNVYVVLLTAMLAMLYELMGMDSKGLLLLRLGETAAGAACAILAARFVAPVSTHDESDTKGAALLRTAAQLLRDAFAADAGSLLDGMRELDGKLQGLRQSVGPVTGKANPAGSDRLRSNLWQLSTIAGCVRQVFWIARDEGLEGLRGTADTLAGNMEAVAGALEQPDREGRGKPEFDALPPAGGDQGPAVQIVLGQLRAIGRALHELR